MSNLKKQLKNNKLSSYFIINSTVFVFFILGLFWLQLIKTDTVEAPKCQYKAITGKDCPTCGITRDFVEISDFKTTEKTINPKSIYYFYFFVYLAVSRFIVVTLNFLKKITNTIIIIDIIVSSILFISLIVFSYIFISN